MQAQPGAADARLAAPFEGPAVPTADNQPLPARGNLPLVRVSPEGSADVAPAKEGLGWLETPPVIMVEESESDQVSVPPGRFSIPDGGGSRPASTIPVSEETAVMNTATSTSLSPLEVAVAELEPEPGLRRPPPDGILIGRGQPGWKNLEDETEELGRPRHREDDSPPIMAEP